jgi:hypothetical protein
MRLHITRWRAAAATVVVIVGLVLGYTVAQVIENDRRTTDLVHENRDLRVNTEALRAQIVALGEEPVVGPTPDPVVGERGPAGTNGRDGRDGADGEDGEDGADGEDGIAGALGPVGATGPAGPAGPQGEAGPAGPQGATGETGPAGAAGPQGPAGATGATGPAGPACPDGYTPTVIEQGPLAGWIACAPIP